MQASFDRTGSGDAMKLTAEILRLLEEKDKRLREPSAIRSGD
jgi:hypothetical protein